MVERPRKLIQKIKMKIKILKRRQKNFTGGEGEEIQYFWYKALRLSDGVTFEFGSADAAHELDEEYDLEIEKREKSNGKLGYVEIVAGM